LASICLMISFLHIEKQIVARIFLDNGYSIAHNDEDKYSALLFKCFSFKKSQLRAILKNTKNSPLHSCISTQLTCN